MLMLSPGTGRLSALRSRHGGFARQMKIGVDVGGTNTDAVLMDGARVLAACKRPTSADIASGVADALRQVLPDPAHRSQVRGVMIGTTQLTNAFVQGASLEKVAAIRIGFPAARGVPPFADWPARLRPVVEGPSYMIRGGYEFDGREIGPLDEAEVVRAAQEILAAGVSNIAVTGVFSQLNRSQELRVAEILREVAPGTSVTLSSQIGRTGLLQRENAALMNASLRALSRRVIGGFRDALRESGLTCSLWISQNDGSLMSPERVEAYPVLTFAAGPTNSLRGAAFLSGIKDALVADIGGTTTDIGVLVNGFPRQSALHVDIGGVRTNFRMPDVLSLGLGGGSRVRCGSSSSTRGACGPLGEGGVTVGPDSVGYRLTEEALVFGGEVLTASDIAAARGRVALGDRGRLGGLGDDIVQAADDEIHRLVEDGLDRMKTSSVPAPLILVGGGAVLIGRPLAGVSETIRLEHAGVANAVGAAIGQIGGEIDRIFQMGGREREAVLEDARKEARREAIAAGADPETLEIVELEILPLQYLPGGAVRVVCRAVGDLAGLEA
jgi:N-methylhydantoinase A/oxoprolinase/acetone carboxylase beta subunit